MKPQIPSWAAIKHHQGKLGTEGKIDLTNHILINLLEFGWGSAQAHARLTSNIQLFYNWLRLQS
jgi:hypothetical protein